MKIISQNQMPSKKITLFNSKEAITSLIMRKTNDFQVSFMELGPNGILGLHQADVDQLFIVIKGTGWTKTNNTSRVQINEGDCVFRNKGEWHETTTQTGLKAVIIEGINLVTF